MTTDGALFKHYIETSRLRPIRVYDSMGISKQAFYKLYESKSFEPDTITRIEKAIGKKWEDVKQIGAGVNIEEVTKGQQQNVDQKNNNLDTLIQSNLVLATANKKLSDAHFILAEDQRELMKKVVTVNDPEQTPEDVDAIRFALLELISQVGSGKRWKSSQEVKATYNKLFSDALGLKKEGDTQKSSGKQHNAAK
jgi:hypothetical protein